MTIVSRSLLVRLILPGIVIILAASALLLVVIERVTRHVQDDYVRFSVTTAGTEASKVLSSAVAEITSANLLDNAFVVDAKQQSVLESLARLWSRNGQQGLVADGRSILTSNLATSEEQEIMRHEADGFFTIVTDNGRLFCFRETFPLWNWTVVTTSRDAPSHFSKEVSSLMPAVAVSCLIMGAALVVLFRKNVQKPVAAMTASVGKGENVDRTGVSEFDVIGLAVNDAMQRLRERSAALEAELGERLRAEAAVHERDEYIKRLLAFTAEGIFGVDTEGTCTFCNPSGLNMLGYESDSELVGRNIHQLIHHSHADGSPYEAADCLTCAAYLHGRKVHSQLEVFWRRDGTSFSTEYWAHPILDGERVTGAVVTFLDISERRQLQDQLLHSQKLEAIGLLAGGIAHDFNNLLSAMMGYGELLHRSLDDNPRLQQFSEQIISLSRRGGELTRALLLFSRKQQMRAEPTDLSRVVGELEKILHRILGEKVELRTRLADSSLIVMADRGHLDQVLMNLVTNARDAMPNGGLLSIVTSVFTVDEGYAGSHTFTVPGKYACLSVSDNGVGMDEETKEKIFQPFFTTKEVGKGTGLGLAIVYGIVKEHGGFINVYSEPGIGTRFRICFPLSTREEEAVAVPSPVRQGTETIMVAEDDPDVRAVLGAVLSSAGYTVIEATNGNDAVEVFTAHSGEIDLLLLDVIMPGRNGWQVWEVVRKIRPDMHVLFMSGYTDDIINREGVLESGMTLIEKPITSGKLLRMLGDVFDGC